MKVNNHELVKVFVEDFIHQGKNYGRSISKAKGHDQELEGPYPAHSGVHNAFHVSMLRKYVTDHIHVLDYNHSNSMKIWATKNNQ